jgi:RNA polymerase sigma factor (TIGR02999 family)
MSQSSEITELLHRWTAGEEEVLDSLLPVVERELRRIARNSLRHQRQGQTLETTELVNEAYLRLVDQTRVQWQNRAHFFAIAAQIMRRVLLDHARRRNRAKRGAGANQISLSSVTILSPQKSQELIALDEALTKLEHVDPFKSRIVELRYFGGLSLEDTAEVLNVAPITVSRHWHLAKAWLKRELA